MAAVWCLVGVALAKEVGVWVGAACVVQPTQPSAVQPGKRRCVPCFQRTQVLAAAAAACGNCGLLLLLGGWRGG